MTTHVYRRIRTAAALAALAAAAGGASCTSMTRSSASNSYLIIDSLQAVHGQSGDESTSLNSDVVAIVEQQVAGQTVRVPTMFQDGGLVTFRLALKDPGSPTVPNVATTNNFITVTRYRVEYARADGRNRPGIDVPHPFDGAFTVTVRAEGTAGAGFVLVRLQAKAEPPLLALRGGDGQFAISTIATVTFYGHDQTGRAVSVSGKISIAFADWADEES